MKLFKAIWKWMTEESAPYKVEIAVTCIDKVSRAIDEASKSIAACSGLSVTEAKWHIRNALIPTDESKTRQPFPGKTSLSRYVGFSVSKELLSMAAEEPNVARQIRFELEQAIQRRGLTKFEHQLGSSVSTTTRPPVFPPPKAV
jgi:hypothetical protein